MAFIKKGIGKILEIIKPKDKEEEEEKSDKDLASCQKLFNDFEADLKAYEKSRKITPEIYESEITL